MKFIKHNRYLDVCIQVVEEYEISRGIDKFLIVKGWFWNMGFVQSFNTGQIARIEIPLGNVHGINNRDWLEIETDQVVGSLRDVNWY
jgi:hypothetical protein